MRPLAVSASLVSRLSAYMSGLSRSRRSGARGGRDTFNCHDNRVKIHPVINRVLKSSQNQVYTADCAAFTEVALRAMMWCTDVHSDTCRTGRQVSPAHRDRPVDRRECLVPGCEATIAAGKRAARTPEAACAMERVWG